LINQGQPEKISNSILSSGDAYIVDPGEGPVYNWNGTNTAVDEKEAAAVQAEQMARDRGAVPITIDQGDDSQESKDFIALFAEEGGLKIVDKALAQSILTKPDMPSDVPTMYKISSADFGGDINAMQAEQVELKKENLDTNLCMVVIDHPQNAIFIWMGAASNVKEKAVAGRVARNFQHDLPGLTREEYEDEGDESADFWAIFG
jgi:hypothetical protein